MSAGPEIRPGWLLAMAVVWLALAVALADAFRGSTALLVPGLVILGWWRPALTLGLFFFLAPGLGALSIGTGLYVAAPVFEALLICFLLVWLVRLARAGRIAFEPRPEDRLVLAFLAVTVVSAVHAVLLRADAPGYAQFPLDLYFNLGQARFLPLGVPTDAPGVALTTPGPVIEETLRPLLTCLEATVAYFCVRNEVRADALDGFRGWIVVTLGVAAFLGTVAALAFDTGDRYQGVSRATGLFSGPNIFGTFLLLGIPIAASCLDAGRWRRGGAALTLALGIACLVWTSSRGAMIGMGVIALLGFRVLLRDRFAIEVREILGAALGGLAIAISLGALVYHQESAPTVNELSHGRYLLWSGGAEMVRAHPLMGVGLGNFARDLRDYYPPGTEAAESYEHAHSWAVHVAAEQGLVAFAVWTALFGLLCWRSIELLPRGSPGVIGLALAVLGVIVHSLFDYTLLVTTISFQFWLVVAMLVSGLEREAALASRPGGERG